MSDNEPVVTVQGGKNTPFYRSQESKQKLIRHLIKEAMEEAHEEHGLRVNRMRFETRWHSSRLEPHLEYGEVQVFDRYSV